MKRWMPWTDAVFARAKALGKPLLAVAGLRAPAALEGVSEEIERLFVAVLADPETRPDAAARVGRGHAVVMDPAGGRRAVLPLPAPDVSSALARLAAEAASGGSGRPSAEAPTWTGAVRQRALGEAPDSKLVAGAFAAAHAAALGEEPSPAVLETLAYAASERADRQALTILERALDRLLAGPCWDSERGAFRADGESALRANARRARLLWDVHALTGEDRWRGAAEGASLFLLRELFDPGFGAFRRDPSAGSVECTADGNAQAASALLRAEAFGVTGAGEAADKALVFLRTKLHDPSFGLRHSASDDATSGLLGDLSWTALAFSESFQATGLRAQRDFADALLHVMFQELWERESGGFLDRVVRAEDPPILREPRLDPELNAVAFEVCWRLHHLKGNANYRRWLDWGLRGVWPADEGVGGRAGLARVADMALRGRLELELVGRAGGPGFLALSRAARRQYSPRAVISFVDPDDQDYLLAHKLAAGPYPRLFGCGLDLGRVSDTDDPARVGEVFAAARSATGGQARGQ